MAEDKRITLRLEPAEFERLDDLRHAKRLSWQGLLVDLLQKWEHGASQMAGRPQEVSNAVALPPALTADQRAAVETLVEMLQVDQASASAYVTLFKSWKRNRPEKIAPGRQRVG